MLREIKKKFKPARVKNKHNPNTVVVMGDCCQSNGVKYMSTPNKRLTNKLCEGFKVYLIDEFRTSKLNWITENEQDNLWLKDKKGKYRKMHSILTYTTESNRLGCINRDLNAVRNMKKLTDGYLLIGKRLENFRRENKKKDETSSKTSKIKTPRKPKDLSKPAKNKVARSYPVSSKK